jgi:spore coat protein U-like protein
MKHNLLIFAICSILLPINGYAFHCSVASTPVSFGNYDVFSTVPLDSTGFITISCSNPDGKPMPITVSISSGGSGSFNPRQMRLAGGTDRMNYYLFIDPSKTTIWGDNTGGTSTFASTIVRNPTLNATIYGRIPAKQDLKAGAYSDSLLVTVVW